VGTKNLAAKVPVNKIKDFEKDFLNQLKTRFADVLKGLNKPMTDDTEKKLQELAKEVSLQYAH
jgi:F-type H+/Na+-transporting ATPase subunit alpha